MSLHFKFGGVSVRPVSSHDSGPWFTFQGISVRRYQQECLSCHTALVSLGGNRQTDRQRSPEHQISTIL